MTATRDHVAPVLNFLTRGRIESVLDRLRPFLQADGVDVELVDVGNTGASIRLTGTAVQRAAALRAFQLELEAVLRDYIEGFGDLRLVRTPTPHP